MTPVQPGWCKSSGLLLRAAREISKELGHCEIVQPLHLLLGLLINVRSTSMRLAQPSWSAVLTAMREFDPPWGDVIVLSPGGQTPTTKRVLERAYRLAVEAREAAGVEHVWVALRECEPELVAAVLSKLGLADGE